MIVNLFSSPLRLLLILLKLIKVMLYRIFASENRNDLLSLKKNSFVSSYLDYVSVMSYDYYGAWDNVTGINAPLYGRDSSEEGNNDEQWKNVVCDELSLWRFVHWMCV